MNVISDETVFFKRLIADYERLAASSNEVRLPLPVELWIQERLRTALDQVQQKTGEDRDGWIEDARYWRLIVERFRQPRNDSTQLVADLRSRANFLREHFSVPPQILETMERAAIALERS